MLNIVLLTSDVMKLLVFTRLTNPSLNFNVELTTYLFILSTSLFFSDQRPTPWSPLFSVDTEPGVLCI